MDLMAIDLGTSSVKVTITESSTGKILSTGKQGYHLFTPHSGWVESDPTSWWTSTVLAVRECLSEYDRSSDSIGAIGLSGQMHGVIPVNSRGNELYNCIMYNDSRADSIINAFPEDVKIRLEEGGCNPLTSMMSAPKLLWLKTNEPSIWAETYKWIMPKDYIRLKLTGDIATDVSDASGTSMMDYDTHKWMQEVEKVGLSLDKFPDIYESSKVVSEISTQCSYLTGLKAGTPVVCGAADMACTALGTAAFHTGIASVTIGSAGHIIVPMDKVKKNNIGRFYQMCHAIPGMYYAFGPILSGGLNLSWIRDIFEEVSETLTFSQLDKLASNAEMGCSGLFYLPYLTGTVVPHSDVRARGAFIGMTLKTRTGDMIRSIMEGVGYAFKDAMKVIIESGVTVNSCNIGEGGSRSQLWSDITAAMLGIKKSSVMKNKDSAPVGATILAGMGIGAYSSWEEATKVLTSIVETPIRTDMQHYYENGYNIYKEIYPSISNVVYQINKL